MKNKLELRKKVAFNLYRQYRKNAAKVHELKQLFWECTMRCNLNCIHCGSDCTKTTDVVDMPLPDFLKVIDGILPLVNPNETLIILTGGEALLRPDLEKCGMELYKRGFPWGMVTNGMLLTERKLQTLLHSGLRSIAVSFDGLQDNHNWFRGNKLSYERALGAIKLLPQTLDLEYDVVTCVNQRNIQDLDQIKQLLIDIGIKKWRLFTVFPTGRAKDTQELQLTNDQFKVLLNFIRNTREQGLIKASYGCEGFLGEYEGEVRDNFFNCHSGINVASVLADGSITGCASMRHGFVQGNVYSDNFWDVWSNRFEPMRNRQWTKKGECEKCSSYKYCEGNGLHLYSNQNSKPAICHLSKING